jgi:Cu2+-exporting ATPase/Cu+-exporting ATPase
MKAMPLTACRYCGLATENTYCCAACEVLDKHAHGDWHSSVVNQFQHFDKSEFQEQAKQPADSSFDYVLFVEGLQCSSCVHLLEKLPEFCDDVLEARVNFGQSTVGVRLKEDGKLSNAAQTISDMGYAPSLLGLNEDPQQKYKIENRNFIMRIAIAGFCAGNIMLFVVPLYAGLAGEWARTFSWLSFFLFLPILFYSAAPFYSGAWNALKYRTISVDIPIVIAMLAGFLFSTYNLLRGDEHIYFDSTASFLFLILSARYLLKRVQQTYLAPSRAQSIFRKEKYLVDDHNELPWTEIKAGNHVLIRAGQMIPADGVLQSDSAAVDMSLFNGESMPKFFSKGMSIFAGTRILDHDAKIEVLKSFTDSRMGQLFQRLDQGLSTKNHFSNVTDKLSQYLVVTVFLIAAVFFVIYSFYNVTEAFHRALALIVLACPCALAFGTPLTFGMALKQAQKRGILMKDASSLEKILTVENIFFDKTGTLTEGELSLSHTAPVLFDRKLRDIILALESQSHHPIAFALRKVWMQDQTLPKVSYAEEILGKGVTGVINGRFYELSRLSETVHDSEIGIELFEDGISLCRLYFANALREESSAIVQKLRQSGHECFLLSGDKKARVTEAAQACGILSRNSFGELYPEDKYEILNRYANTCMIGDGANDAMSLQAADVGIAVKGSIDISLQNADVYFTRAGLSPLSDFIEIAKKSRVTLIRNLAISLIYNSVGGVLALMGFVNPLVAAVLMPISSALIIFSTWWGFR